MEVEAIASRYTSALFDVVRDGDFAAARDELNSVGQLLSDSSDFAAFVANPLINQEQQEAVIHSLFAGKVSETILNFLKLLVRRRRLAILPAAIPSFSARVDEAEGVQPVEITSAVALSPEQLNALCDKLAQRTGKRVRPTVFVDESLVGGFRIRIGDRIEDFSIATKLANFKTNVINA